MRCRIFLVYGCPQGWYDTCAPWHSWVRRLGLAACDMRTACPARFAVLRTRLVFMMRCLSGFTLLCLVLLQALPAYAATYYVAPSGSDSNSGAAGSPWLTIGHSTSSTISGDTVLIAAGVYNERDNTGAAGVTFRCTGTVTNNGWSINHTNVTVDGFTMTGAPAGWNGACVSLAATAHGTTVINCNFLELGAATYGMMLPSSGTTSDTDR